jgi:hypothetical protein
MADPALASTPRALSRPLLGLDAARPGVARSWPAQGTLTIPVMLYSMNAMDNAVSSQHSRWLIRPIGFHALAAVVLVFATVGGIIGGLIAASWFDPRPLIASDSYEFDPAQHPSTAGYIGEIVVASIPVIVICLFMIPLLRRAGSPWPRVAALAFALIPIGAICLGVIDSSIRDNQTQGCCAGPGLTGPWWHIWATASIALALASLLSSILTLRRRDQPDSSD